MNKRKPRDLIGNCPVCNFPNHFDHLPKIGKAIRCPHCKHWLKVSSRLPVCLEAL